MGNWHLLSFAVNQKWIWKLKSYFKRRQHTWFYNQSGWEEQINLAKSFTVLKSSDWVGVACFSCHVNAWPWSDVLQTGVSKPLPRFYRLLYRSVIFIPRIDLSWNVPPSYGGFWVLLLLMILQWGIPPQRKGNKNMITKLGSETHKEASYSQHLHAVPAPVQHTRTNQNSTTPDVHIFRTYEMKGVSKQQQQKN